MCEVALKPLCLDRRHKGVVTLNYMYNVCTQHVHLLRSNKDRSDSGSHLDQSLEDDSAVVQHLALHEQSAHVAVMVTDVIEQCSKRRDKEGEAI